MSIPVYFDWYDQHGCLLAKYKSFFTVSITAHPGDLNMLSKRIAECDLNDHQKYIHADVRYIVPHSATDYMFDLKDPRAILPNRFKHGINT